MPKGKEIPPFKEPQTEKQKQFCHEFRKDRNITKAAIRAGCPRASAHTIGWRWLQKDAIKAYIEYLDEEERKRANLTREDLVLLAREIVHANPADYLDDSGKVTFNHDSPNRRAVSEITVITDSEGGTVTKLKLRDPSVAAERVSKLLGLDAPPPPEKKEITFRVVRGEENENS